jgi:hypothetical protein
MTERERRTVVTALGLVMGTWLALRAIPALTRRVVAERNTRIERTRLLVEAELTLASLSAMEDSAKRLTAGMAAAAPQFLAGGSANVALADLNGRLGTLAARRRIRLMSLESRADSLSAGQARQVRAVARLESDFRGLAEWLDDLERLPLALAPETILVTATAPFAARRAPERLTAEVELVAWYLAAPEGQ